ncbi:MAG TPA: tRNA (N(6)-L-threonylcarbamoyladenosine(37)-C(2))-methylthiotransferase MtaB [Candidatus Angelobacter sp.]|nr:tRNA (N(6)-L-threonylcarbamoyladenosine(37)-C(2))-methylthiotransferase MtaB [Candidatus Angelobacter sp.]
MPEFFVQSFGCRATQADSALLERQLASAGLRVAVSDREADLVVLNTCTVTAAADQDARAAVRRIHRENPAARILVTGCYAQRAPHELAALPGVTWVVGNSHKHRIAEMVAGSALPSGDREETIADAGAVTGNSSRDFVSLEAVALSAPAFTLVGDIFAHTELIAAPVFPPRQARNVLAGDPVVGDSIAEKTRPNLKVQDGCDNRCCFCIIPSVRGQSRSMKLERVIAEANALVAAGYREIVLSGINLGRWGRDLAQIDGTQQRFEQLVRALLEHTDVQKIRISSVEPMDWSDELIALVAGSFRIARHAHVPLQSGSDRILRRMHRKYRPWHYAEKIRKIHEAMPLAAIGADVMTGFPGETDELFEESRSFIEHLPFTYLHVFTYSSRPGTPSAAMPEQVPVQVARERNRILRELAAEKNLEFRRKFLGRTLEVITLQTSDDDWTEALSDNYLKVKMAGRLEANQILTAEITGIADEELVAVAQQAIVANAV